MASFFPQWQQYCQTKKSSPDPCVSSAQSAEEKGTPHSGQARTPSFSKSMRSSVYRSETVPTVERGFKLAAGDWGIKTAGEAPVIRVTSGFRIPCIPMASRYSRWHSVKSTSMSRVDFPEPERPVKTTSLFLGMDRDMSFKLPSRAPSMRITASPRFPLVLPSKGRGMPPGSADPGRNPSPPD